jgi:hypothetical protein
MNTSYSLLLKAGGSVIYRVFNGEAFDYTIEAIEDSELLLLTASARRNECTTCFERYQRLLLKTLYCFAIKSKLRFNRNC